MQDSRTCTSICSFARTQSIPIPKSFVGQAGDLGAVFNGTTSEERVNYYLTVSSDSLDAGIRFLSSALRSPLFRQDELERERQVVIGEYDRNESSPFFQLITGDGQAPLSWKLQPQEHHRRPAGHSHDDGRKDADDSAQVLRPQQLRR